MSLSRRAFVKSAAGAAATGAFIAGRGHEALAGLLARGETPVYAAEPGMVIISSNENPMGPGKAVMDAVRAGMGATAAPNGRYPFGDENHLIETIAAKWKVKKENVLIGCGSTQILRTATQVFTSKDKALVGSIPTYEECAGYAELMGSPVKGVKLDSALAMDLDATAEAAKGSGLIFYCNPNNPTATVHTPSDTDAFIKKVHQLSPGTTFLVDEAYIDYVTTPGHKSEIERAINDERVVVARTFSKAYGMAGLRVGYAIGHEKTIKKMAEWEHGGSLNILGINAAIAALNQDPNHLVNERKRNTEARDMVRGFFKKNGFKDTESQTNFIFVETRMPIQDFQKACREKGILVARPFPPLTNWARISIGTMDEMKKAVDVFAQVLNVKAAAAA
ncbi:MAG: aminotransferase class I/II-fold pyridoxal phosphate-dependent enzyme [Vicinamibacterales bacterium]